MWRDEIKRAAVPLKHSTQSLKKNNYVCDLHLPPIAPAFLTVQRPPGRPHIEYLAGNVAFVS